MRQNDQRSDAETKRLSDVVLRRMLRMPPAKKQRKAPKTAKRVK
jgi:hypothetical protein